MRPRLILLAVLLAVMVAAAAVLAPAAARQADELVLTAETVYGDPAAAQGLTLHATSQLDGYLHWDTAVTLGEPLQWSTDFSFTPTRTFGRGGEGEGESYLADTFSLNYGASGSGGLDLEDLALPEPMLRIVREIADRTENSQTHTETAELSQYCRFVPWTFGCYLDPAPLLEAPDVYSGQEEFWEDAGDFLRIPAQGLQWQVEITKDDQGRIIDMNTALLGDGADQFLTTNVVPDDRGLYFTVAGYHGGDEVQQLSALETLVQGNGVYYLPLEAGEDPSGWPILRVDTAHIRLVFPLPEEEPVWQLRSDPAGQRLLLITGGPDGSRLRVLDRGRELTQLQQLPLLEAWTPLNVWFLDNGLAAVDGDLRLAFLALEDGRYVRRIDADLTEAEMAERIYGASLAYDGRRLLLAGWQDHWDSCDLWAAVCTPDGLAYAARLQNSQSQDWTLDRIRQEAVETP